MHFQKCKISSPQIAIVLKISGLSDTLFLCFPCLYIFVLRSMCAFRAHTDDQASEAIDIKFLLLVVT